MDIAKILTDILVVLVAAKAAAEIAERFGAPAVVGEIVAGILIGPSALGLVGHNDEVLRTLGEIGVILLLLEVGMEMDLAELGKVGRASFLVAVVGVAAPMALGFGAMEMLGFEFKTSLFVGAALTATSVGITARVFGDLRALATTEARIVLGAAVADDVMGLVVLTVVVRLVTEGSVSPLSVVGIVAVAVAFLVLGAGIGLRLAQPLFSLIHRVSRQTGTMVALALAFTLAFATAADAAKLAPIVGAFVAGIALTRSDQSERIHRELGPVGHLFIPVFFLQIGIDAQISAFASAAVLRDAAVLLVVAIIGKLVSPVGAIGSPGDKLLIGLGMLPRGEVGLIFATLGRAAGVLNDELYASLLLVVLVTTLVTPQLLKMRYSRLSTETMPTIDEAGEPQPSGGWLRITREAVDLAARPPAIEAVRIALVAAVAVAHREPGPRLTEWLRAVPEGAKRWRVDLMDELLDVIERGNGRSWRFLDVSAVLEGVSASLAGAITHRLDDARSIDPLGRYRFESVERLRRLDGDDPIAVEAQHLLDPRPLILALLLVDALDAEYDAASVADAVGRELSLPDDICGGVTALVADADLLWAASMRPAAFESEAVLSLASHLRSPERARALYVLTRLHHDGERWQWQRIDEMYRLVQAALENDELTGAKARNLIDDRRRRALTVVEGKNAADRIEEAPRAYVLRQSAEAIARHAEFLRRPVGGDEVRVRALSNGDEWLLDVATRDRPGLLADVTGVLAKHRLSVVEAVVATWADGIALEAFRVNGDAPDCNAIAADIRAAFAIPLSSEPLHNATVTFDQSASPWHTVCDVVAPDRPGLLHTIATGFAAAGVDVVAATIGEADGRADDRFELVDRNGRKLSPDHEAAITRFLEAGVVAKRRWFRPRYEPAPAAVR
ncbi:MAG: cation:proton antiporter [Actinobacteria bacterium]|nr:cation:proton antiporter [Actinomycetota bacterium]